MGAVLFGGRLNAATEEDLNRLGFLYAVAQDMVGSFSSHQKTGTSLQG